MPKRILDGAGRGIDSSFFRAGGQDADKSPFERWIGRKLSFRSLTAAATSQAVLAFSLPAHTVIHDAAFELEADFAGGAISAMTAALGISGGDVDAFIEEMDIFTGVANDELLLYNTLLTRGVLLADPTGGDTHPYHGYYVGTAAIEVDVNFVSTAADVNVATAGVLIAYLKISNPREAFVVG